MSQCDTETPTASCTPSRIVLENGHVPKRGRYHNALVQDETNSLLYFYDSCGAYIELTFATGTYPVTSVQGQVGDVVLDMGDIGAIPVDTLTFNVQDHGAVGDGTTDDTAAIKATMLLAKVHMGRVYVPGTAAFYKITDDLPAYTGLSMIGDSMESSTIKQVTLNKNGLRGDGCSSIVLKNIAFVGNGTGSTVGTGTGKGLYLTYGTAGNNPFHNFENVMVRNWGSDGVYVQTIIVSTLSVVYSAYNGGHGFRWPEGGTSCNFQACWARQNAQAGYSFNTSVYQSLTGCASDNNGVNYDIIDAQSIGFFGCGSEGALRNGGSYDGIGWRVSNSSVIGLWSCWVTDNRNIGVQIINGSNGIELNVADNSPHAADSQLFTASGNFTVPAGVISVFVEATGGGGAGGGRTTNGGGGGGAGGAYAASTISVTPGAVIPIVVGAGGTAGTGAGGAGGDSTFNTNIVKGQGGVGGGTGVSPAGGTGSTASSIGTTLYAGGNGGNGGGAISAGGGGGEGAGSTGAGAAGALGTGTRAGGTGGAGGDGGAGGGPSPFVGNPGAAPGGAGGGAVYDGTNRAGGAGARGQVLISYHIPIFIETQSGTNVIIQNLHNSSANNLAAGTAVILNDGAGGITAKTFKVSGTSGDLAMTADADGAEYNLKSTTTGALALFGTGGGARLDLRLLDGKFFITTPETPASAAAAGTVGQIAWDTSYVYVCVAANTWKRTAIATW